MINVVGIFINVFGGSESEVLSEILWEDGTDLFWNDDTSVLW